MKFQGAKKSLYLFLSALMGMILFLVIHRLAVFFFMVASNYNQTGLFANLSSLEFYAFDYLSLILFSLFGLWYGIWLGGYWYAMVYEQEQHRGFVHSLARYNAKIPSYSNELKTKVQVATQKLEQDIKKLENLALKIPASLVSPLPVKRRVSRKKTVKSKL